jgi:hypothetical protein
MAKYPKSSRWYWPFGVDLILHPMVFSPRATLVTELAKT